MENQIKQVNDYFVDKLLNEDFTVESIDQYRVNVVIDGKYHFSLWIGNNQYFFNCYQHAYSFMDLDFDDVQKQYLFDYFIRLKKDRERERLVKEKQKIENKLKNL